MATWKEIETAAPELAARARKILDAHKHKTIATLRADGSPRLSGIEVDLVGDDLTFGSMPGARKGADLHRDPRFAVHSATVDPPEGNDAAWVGDAKVAGRAVHAGELSGSVPGELFRGDLHELVVTALNETATAMVIESWTSTAGLRRIERA